MQISIPSFNGKPYTINLKKFIFPVLFLIIIMIIFFKVSELKEIGRLFLQMKWYLLAVILLSQIINLGLQSGTYYNIFKILKFPHINFFKLMRITLVMIFLDFTIPSYGIAGNIYMLKFLTKRGHKEGKVLMMIVLQLITYYISLISLIIVTLTYFFIKTNHLGLFQIIVAIGFVSLFVAVYFIVKYLLGNREKAPKRMTWIAKKALKLKDGEELTTRINLFLKDFYKDLDWIKHNKKIMIKPIIIQFTKFLSDGLTVFLIFLALGHLATYGVSLSTFAFGKLFGLITFIPGGFGATEGSMTLTSNALGIGLELSITAMLIYRFFSYWLYFPFGLVFYKYFEKKSNHIEE